MIGKEQGIQESVTTTEVDHPITPLPSELLSKLADVFHANVDRQQSQPYLRGRDKYTDPQTAKFEAENALIRDVMQGSGQTHLIERESIPAGNSIALTGLQQRETRRPLPQRAKSA